MELLESTRKAALWDSGTRFIVTIGQNKRKPQEEDQTPFRRDKAGLLILKESSWRYPYDSNNKETMLEYAKKLYHLHA